jgi:hypothetical protein
MSFPFGGHPTFSAYIAWAKTQGCIVQSGYSRHTAGRPVSLTKIVAPNGRWVIEVGTLGGEYLVPTTIDRLDRRLGIISPFLESFDQDTQANRPLDDPGEGR